MAVAVAERYAQANRHKNQKASPTKFNRGHYRRRGGAFTGMVRSAADTGAVSL